MVPAQELGLAVYLLVSGATATVERLLATNLNLGILLTPRAGNKAPEWGTVWAADNGCFTGFDDQQFRAFLKRIKDRNDCKFVCSPDVVANHEETLGLWPKWSEIIRANGLRPAFVAQDGCTVRTVPWDAGAIFIGGSTRYKLGESAAEILAEAHWRGRWTHMGRVNTGRRILYAAALGVDSVDGSSFSKWANTHLPWALRLATQRPLPLRGNQIA